MKSLITLPIITLPIIIFLISCLSDNNALKLKPIAKKEVTKTAPQLSPMPTLIKYEPYQYNPQHVKSPFVGNISPFSTQTEQKKHCLSPDIKRKNRTLGLYHLHELTIRGILVKNEKLWALIENPHHQIHPVSLGDHLGLENSKVEEISNNYIKLTTLVLSGDNCWFTQETKLVLANKKE